MSRIRHITLPAGFVAGASHCGVKTTDQEDLAIIAAAGVILTAGYILWTIQRVYLGPEYKGPHADEITPMNRREMAIGGVLLFFAIALGVFPGMVFSLMHESTALLVDSLDAGYQALASQADTAVRTALGK